MTLGRAPKQEEIWRETTAHCDEQLSPTSIYRLLHVDCHRLFPDEAFADLFQDIGRRSVPPRIVAVVMVLQRLEGLSDREAVDRFTFDVRWKYAAGGGGASGGRPWSDGGERSAAAGRTSAPLQG